MKQFKRFTAIFIVSVILVSLLSLTAIANPSTYWCGTHKKTGCTHCASHSMQAVGTNTANCVTGGGQVRVCTAAGCGAAFYQNVPTAHKYNTTGDAQSMCNGHIACGNIIGAGSSHFQNYMYRTTRLTGQYRPNYMSNGPGGHGSNNGMDITCGLYDAAGKIQGHEIYAQGTGTLRSKGGSTTTNTGFTWKLNITAGMQADGS